MIKIGCNDMKMFLFLLHQFKVSRWSMCIVTASCHMQVQHKLHQPWILKPTQTVQYCTMSLDKKPALSNKHQIYYEIYIFNSLHLPSLSPGKLVSSTTTSHCVMCFRSPCILTTQKPTRTFHSVQVEGVPCNTIIHYECLRVVCTKFTKDQNFFSTIGAHHDIYPNNSRYMLGNLPKSTGNMGIRHHKRMKTVRREFNQCNESIETKALLIHYLKEMEGKEGWSMVERSNMVKSRGSREGCMCNNKRRVAPNIIKVERSGAPITRTCSRISCVQS